jgi:hypothetical protein
MAGEWTPTVTKRDGHYSFKRGDGRTLSCFVFTCLSGAGHATGITLDSLLTTAYGAKEAERLMYDFAGSSLYWVNYIAGAVTPTTESQIIVYNENSISVFDSTVTTAATSQGWAGNVDTEYHPLISPIITITTLAADKTATIYFWFIK